VFTKTAAWYDLIYAEKDYARESARVTELIHLHQRSAGNTLLDVACGTGGHLTHLTSVFDAEGIDIDETLLAIAGQRLPQVHFHRADMCRFDLGRTFDAVTCLFSSIGYARTPGRLNSAIQCFERHLKPGGVLVLEPWLPPGRFTAGFVSLEAIDREEIKIARMQRSTIEAGVSVLNFDYLVGTSEAVEHFTERHELGLFSPEQMHAALEACGLMVDFDPDGLMGRGLYIGTKAIERR
jgi:SAM-dependent methyltransferase